MLSREAEAPSALGSGAAAPHVYLDGVERPVIVFLRLARPLAMQSPDGVPVRYLFMLLGPVGRAAEHLDTLLQIVRAAYHARNGVTAKQPTATIRLTRISCMRVRPHIGGLQVIGRNFL